MQVKTMLINDDVDDCDDGSVKERREHRLVLLELRLL